MSPHFLQANGAVNIAKRILRQPDIFLILMAYRSTPITTAGVRHAELLMDRKMKTILPSHPNKLKLKWPNLRKIKKKMDHIKHETREIITKNMRERI